MTAKTSSPSFTLQRTRGADRCREFWKLRTEVGPVTFEDFFTGLCHRQSVRELLLDAWARTTFSGFLWELPPLTLESRRRPFECAIIEAAELHGRRADSAAFYEHLDKALAVSVFPNLGGDATLVVPSFEAAASSSNGHLADFARRAPRAQAHAVLAVLAETVMNTCTNSPLWVSTSGLGVPWLHFRLDSYPKYYHCHEYRTSPVRASV